MGMIQLIWKSADGSDIHNTFKFDRVRETRTWAIDNVDESGKTAPFARLRLT
jgi:hypothetical protein